MSLNQSLVITSPNRHDGATSTLPGTGGMAVLHQGRAIEIDRADSTGLCMARGRVFRLVRALNTIWAYDLEGRQRWTLRVDIKNGHDVRLLDGVLAVVSTAENLIRWYDLLGNPVEEWRAPGEGDAWHLNCITDVNGLLYATAFGTFYRHRAWKDADQMSGFLMNLQTRERVLDSLSEPHSPRFIDGRWLVCESATANLVALEGGRARRIPLQGYTRGMDADGRFVYVGESRSRGDERRGTVVALDRKTLAVVERVEVPFSEIYEVLVVPESVVRGLIDGAN